MFYLPLSNWGRAGVLTHSSWRLEGSYHTASQYPAWDRLGQRPCMPLIFRGPASPWWRPMLPPESHTSPPPSHPLASLFSFFPSSSSPLVPPVGRGCAGTMWQSPDAVSILHSSITGLRRVGIESKDSSKPGRSPLWVLRLFAYYQCDRWKLSF